MTTPENSNEPIVSTNIPNPLGAVAGSPLASTRPRGGITSRSIRTGALARDVGSDVTNALDASIPVFGNVLQSIGDGVATSQKAMDQGVIDTVNKLNNTTIKVVTSVVEVLGDDGLPDISQTKLITENVSLLNFFTPTIHEWKNVSVSMDLSVGSFHSEQGLQFSQRQHSESSVATGMFWGFLGWFDTDTTDRTNSLATQKSSDVAWQSGQIRVDALLGPRKTGKFPVAASVSVGPQIYVTQGVVQEQKTGNIVTSRNVEVEAQVRKASGDPNPNKNITLNSGGLLPSFPNGSATDANGKVKFTLTRTLIPGFTAAVGFQVNILFGQLRKTFAVTL